MQGPQGATGAQGSDATLPTAALGQVLVSQGAAVPAVFSPSLMLAGNIALGTNPAQSGALRLPNSAAINFRNGANTADVSLIFNDVNDDVHIGQGAVTLHIWAGLYPRKANLNLGAGASKFLDCFLSSSVNIGTNPALSGGVRLGNNLAIRSRNPGNTGDVNIALHDGANVLAFGDDAVNTQSRTSGYYLFWVGATPRLYLEATKFYPATDNAYDAGGSANRFRDLFAGRRLVLDETAFTNLPASTVGTLANVSDSNNAVVGGTVAGGGTNHVLARYNGSTWKVVA